jgi:hypothetical protein
MLPDTKLALVLICLSWLLACSPGSGASVAEACEFCGSTSEEHSGYVESASWLGAGHQKQAILAAGEEAGLRREDMLPSKICPRVFGELPPAGTLRILAPTVEELPGQSKTWTWVVIANEVFTGSALGRFGFSLYGAEQPRESSPDRDRVWFLKLCVESQLQSAGRVMKASLEICSANGIVRVKSGMSAFASIDLPIEELVRVSTSEMLLTLPANLVIGSVDGNVVGFRASHATPSDEAIAWPHSPWRESNKQLRRGSGDREVPQIK